MCDLKFLKEEAIQIRLIVGGDGLDYPYDASSQASNSIDTKIILNSTILDADKGTKFIAADLKAPFLNTPM